MFYNTLHRFLRLSLATHITTIIKNQNALRPHLLNVYSSAKNDKTKRFKVDVHKIFGDSVTKSVHSFLGSTNLPDGWRFGI
jgi:hypothetical protein